MLGRPDFGKHCYRTWSSFKQFDAFDFIPDAVAAVVVADVATLMWCHFRPTTIRQLLWLAQKRWHSHLQIRQWGSSVNDVTHINK